ncbi:MAG: helix-turn-helix domain-containing protein [Tannerella sp.]|jgi:excisionase family DNA binding protein|nr:helix-turn-helix domain-containing protein [Tannerella sp.]
MKHSLIDQSDERIISMLGIIEKLSHIISEINTRTMKRPLNNEFYLTDKEICEKLKVSRRTLQEWRYSGRISYIQIGGKIIFRESDIQALLEKHLRKAFR